jgi:hypothetical protein
MSDLSSQTLGDIKALIPQVEGDLQLALAGAIADLTAQNNNNTQTLLLNQFALEKSIAAVDTNVDRQACDIKTTILGALSANRISDLEQQLTVAQLRESEQRQINRETVNSHNVTTTANTRASIHSKPVAGGSRRPVKPSCLRHQQQRDCRQHWRIYYGGANRKPYKRASVGDLCANTSTSTLTKLVFCIFHRVTTSRLWRSSISLMMLVSTLWRRWW